MKRFNAPACPFCGKRATFENGQSRYRRGPRVVSVKTKHWRCPSDCQGPDGSRPFLFEDPQLLRANDEAARAAWQRTFDEEMPLPKRPGRKPEEPRGERVQVLLSRREREALDRTRGSRSRSEVLRARTFDHAGGGPEFPLEDSANPRGPHLVSI